MWSSPQSQQESKMHYLGAISKMTERSQFISEANHKSQYPSLCPEHWCWRSWSWTVLWRPIIPYRTNTKKRCPFHYRDWNAKVEIQEIPGVTGKFGLGVQNEVWQKLTEFCQENTLFIANTLFQQHKRWLYPWTSPDGQYWNQIDYTFCRWRWRSSI